ncbi:hypothetical protein NBRC116493_32630 [Aurantivibrio infirmus]
MNEQISQIKTATRKKFLFGEKPVYSQGKKNSPELLSKVEEKYRFTFPPEIKEFLLELGSGSTEDFYINHAEQIYPFDEDNGPIEGFVAIATDTLGNYFVFNPKSENDSEIFYCCHDPLGYGKVAPDIGSFLKSFVGNGFKNLDITNELSLTEYE